MLTYFSLTSNNNRTTRKNLLVLTSSWKTNFGPNLFITEQLMFGTVTPTTLCYRSLLFNFNAKLDQSVCQIFAREILIYLFHIKCLICVVLVNKAFCWYIFVIWQFNSFITDLYTCSLMCITLKCIFFIWVRVYF